MSKKSDRNILIILKAIKKSVSNIEENVTPEVYVDSEQGGIKIPEDVYEEICKELESEEIDFMGIT
jgi:hypothetical protein